eukprot:TRINITY_DN38090_c0_g1_i1.p1 TRINITY_DN38090_c0_g1~~TRINITY_DN38090_c0_g1_i1.p1  ORF type:complete len:228 (-),score=63.82 TRINITY_DN38090_c0_g1_i1:206-889(-)
MPRRLTLLVSDDGWVTVLGDDYEHSRYRRQGRQSWQGLQEHTDWRADWYDRNITKKETKEEGKLDEMKARIAAMEAAMVKLSDTVLNYESTKVQDQQEHKAPVANKAAATVKELQESFEARMQAMADDRQTMSTKLKTLEEQLKDGASVRQLNDKVKYVEQLIAEVVKPLDHKLNAAVDDAKELLKLHTDSLAKGVNHLTREMDEVFTKVINIECRLGLEEESHESA